MAKQTASPKQPTFKELKNTFHFFPFKNQTAPFIVIILLGLIFNLTSLHNEYALDDGIIIHQNDHVIKGIKGIKDIMTKDAYESFYRRMNATDQLAGGRYRPLSVVSFAIEQQFIGAYPKDGLYPQQCWDTNGNKTNDVEEDINDDGVFNEVDCQVKGASLRHFVNIITFIIGVMLLYLFFRNYIFKTNHDLAFLAALIFLMHPIHSEAIANVKSRDEIFSLIFISLTFFFSFKYMQDKKTKTLFWAAFNFLLALLSKEYAVVLVMLIPIAFYVFEEIDFDPKTFLKSNEFKQAMYIFGSFFICALLMLMVKRNSDMHIMPGQKATTSYWLFPFVYLIVGVGLIGTKIKKPFATLMSWHFFIMLFYLGMRLVAVKLKPGVPDTEILNNPYLLATQQEQWATKVFVLLKYFSLCWFPHPLSSDYSFNTIQFRTFASWDTLVSLVLHIGLLFAGFKLILKKHLLGFAIAVYFAFLLMIGNILMDIGATMGERLLFHSTIGFVIAFAWLILKGADKIPGSLTIKRVALFSVLGVMTFLYGCKTWERNWDWKNDITLFLKDVETVPNSVLVLGNAGARYIDLSDTKNFVAKREESLEKGIKYLKHAIELHPRYVNGYLNLGLGSYKLHRDRDALFYWKQAEYLYPNNPYLKNYYIVFYNDLLNRGYQKAQRGQLDSAIYELRKTIILDKLNPEGFYNLGGAYYQNKQYDKAKLYWEQCLKIKPDHAQAKAGLATIVTVTVPSVPQPQGVKQ
ncbi:MAG: bacteriophage receptor, outer rane subunit [Bacteroidetes bacterium]|jgi:tetratricopeptide (TPR) repeat protein|nr:bacteriophage receptor, outer rane subunit [Bacteroidota bacterium]